MNTANTGNTVNGLWQPVCHALRKFHSTWLAEAEHPCAFSNTRGEALRCRARRGLGRESLHSGAATAPKILGAAEWHRALSRLLTARGGEEASASNRKEAALRAAGLHTAHGAKGRYTGGKVRFPPVRPVHGVHQRTKQIPTGWQSTWRNAQGGSKETMNTANTGNTMDGLWQPVCHALWNFDSTGLCVLLAGRAHCAKPIL